MLRIEKKKLISILFVILILVNNFLSIVVYAENNNAENTADTEEITTNYEIKDEEEWDISKNGDGSVKAKWILEDKSLTITGSGEMKDWETWSNEDWHSSKYTQLVEKVTILDGIMNIGNYAFYGCSSLECIEIPNSVNNIGFGIFSGCIDLMNINVEKNNIKFMSCNGILYNKAQTILKIYPAGKKEKDYIIPDNTTTIAQHAFKGCNSLETLKIPDSVISIEHGAFNGCSSLKNIEISNSVSRIEYLTFRIL